MGSGEEAQAATTNDRVNEVHSLGLAFVAAHPEYVSAMDFVGVEGLAGILTAVASVPRVNDPSVRPYPPSGPSGDYASSGEV